MYLTSQQIQELIDELDKFHITFIANNVGESVLTDAEKKILVKSGVDLSKLNKISRVEEAFRWGLLAQSLGQKEAQKLSYKEFKKMFSEGKLLPMTKAQKFALDSLRYQTYSDIKGLGNRISRDFRDVFIEDNKKQRLRVEKIIKKETERAVLLRESTREFASRLKTKTQDWARDFDRIADFVLHSAMDNGKANAILEEYGEDAQVYKQVYAGACKSCQQAYLTSGLGSQPKVFKLKDLIANGTNIGKKTAQWQPIVGPHHPWSLTDGRTVVLTESGWKSIKDIKVGEYVLTHKGRFKRVVSVVDGYKIGSDYPIKKRYVLKYKVGGKVLELSLTAEHKVLTTRGWQQVQNITKDDKILKLTKPCQNKNCDKYVDYFDNKHYRSCCSKDCENEIRRISAKKLDRDIVFREKIANSVKQNWREGIHDLTLKTLLSKENRQKNKERLMKDDTAINMMRKAGFNIISKPQRRLFDKVNDLVDEEVLLEYKIFGKSLDIAIPELKINIEFDGKYWHKDRQEQDNKRDELLRSNGWHILRYSKQPTQKELLKDIERVSLNSKGEYRFEAIEIEELIVSPLKPETKLYDIGVEGDESFVARGVVIHNCRCELFEVMPDMGWDSKTQSFTKPIPNDYGIKRKSVIKITST